MKLTIFPNYAVLKIDNSLWIESSQLTVNQTLLNEKIEIDIAAVDNYSNNYDNFEKLNNGVNFESLGLFKDIGSNFQKINFYLRILPRLIKVVKKSQFNYIYCPGNIGFIAAIISIIYNIPYAIYLRGEWKDSTPKVFHAFFYRIIKNSKFVICTGFSLTETISKINNKCISVVPMSPLLFSNHKTISTRKDSIINILFVGQLIKAKGVYELIHAFILINKNSSNNIKLTMIGGGNEKAGLEKIIKENNLADCIQIYSINSDVKALSEVYNSSDIFCLPTYTEGFPRVLYEAMFFSLPIITTNVGQISSLIRDDFNGLFCETRSINSLVNKLELLISDTNKRRTLGLNAKKTIEPLLHDWKNNSHGKQIIDLLRELEINIKSVK